MQIKIENTIYLIDRSNDHRAGQPAGRHIFIDGVLPEEILTAPQRFTGGQRAAAQRAFALSCGELSVDQQLAVLHQEYAQ